MKRFNHGANARAAGLLNLFLALLMVGISLPCFLGRVGPNPHYGFRIEKSYASEENWYKINRHGAEQQMIWAGLMAVVGVACFFLPRRYFASKPLFMLILLGPLMAASTIPMVQTLIYAARL